MADVWRDAEETWCQYVWQIADDGSMCQTVLCYVSGPLEYCIMDTMNITCDSESVIVINTALYGLMNIGRCVQNNYGHSDCSNDVMPILDAVCSGKQKCAFIMPKQEMHNMYRRNPKCPPELAPYLEVTYRCIRGKCIYWLNSNMNLYGKKDFIFLQPMFCLAIIKTRISPSSIATAL